MALNKTLLLSKLTADAALRDSNITLTDEFGDIRVSDPEFRGRRTNDDGSEFILVHIDDSKQPKAFTLQKGCPKGVNTYKVSRWELVAAYTNDKGVTYDAGHPSYRAYGIVEEED